MKKVFENVFHSSTLTDENVENVPGFSLNILEVLPARPAKHCCSGRRKIKKSMDNAGFQVDSNGSNGTELRTVTILPTDSVDRLKMSDYNGATTSTGCRPEACIAARKKYLEQGPNSANPSPWHRRKTIYLVTVISALVIWVVIYSVLNTYNVL